MRSPAPESSGTRRDRDSVMLSIAPRLVRRDVARRLPPARVDFRAALHRGVKRFREMDPAARATSARRWSPAPRPDARDDAARPPHRRRASPRARRGVLVPEWVSLNLRPAPAAGVAAHDAYAPSHVEGRHQPKAASVPELALSSWVGGSPAGGLRSSNADWDLARRRAAPITTETTCCSRPSCRRSPRHGSSRGTSSSPFGTSVQPALPVSSRWGSRRRLVRRQVLLRDGVVRTPPDHRTRWVDAVLRHAGVDDTRFPTSGSKTASCCAIGCCTCRAPDTSRPRRAAPAVDRLLVGGGHRGRVDRRAPRPLSHVHRSPLSGIVPYDYSWCSWKPATRSSAACTRLGDAGAARLADKHRSSNGARVTRVGPALWTIEARENPGGPDHLGGRVMARRARRLTGGPGPPGSHVVERPSRAGPSRGVWRGGRRHDQRLCPSLDPHHPGCPGQAGSRRKHRGRASRPRPRRHRLRAARHADLPW